MWHWASLVLATLFVAVGIWLAATDHQLESKDRGVKIFFGVLFILGASALAGFFGYEYAYRDFGPPPCSAMLREGLVYRVTSWWGDERLLRVREETQFFGEKKVCTVSGLEDAPPANDFVYVYSDGTRVYYSVHANGEKIPE